MPSCVRPNQVIDTTGNAPVELKNFAQALMDFHQMGESGLQKSLELFEWTQVDEETRNAVTRSLYFDLDTPIQSLKIENWDDSQQDSFFTETTLPNLPPQWIFHIHFESNPPLKLSLLVGKNGNNFKIVNPVKIPEIQPGSPSPKYP